MSNMIIIRALNIIVISIALFGCVKEIEQLPSEIPQENLREVVFHAGWGAETKTALQEDGSVRIPEPLQMYMGGKDKIEPKNK